jgi:hypothetical protein
MTLGRAGLNLGPVLFLWVGDLVEPGSIVGAKHRIPFLCLAQSCVLYKVQARECTRYNGVDLYRYIRHYLVPGTIYGFCAWHPHPLPLPTPVFNPHHIL